MVAAVHDAEAEFDDPLISADEAAARAVAIAASASRPVVIADPQDNPGAGGAGDTTGLLSALLTAGARRACLSMIWDPATAKQAASAGVGAEFQGQIGGHYPQFGAPIAAHVRVEAVSTEPFACTGPMYGGSIATLHPTALLLILAPDSEVRVIVGAGRTQNADQAMFTHLGVDPTQQDILVVKSAVHFLADYEPIAETVLFAAAPGANPCRHTDIPYTRLRPDLRLTPNGAPFG